VISLGGGNPAPEALPVAQARQILAQALDENPMAALLYSQSEGHPPLRARLKDFARERYGAFNPETDDLMVVSGAQQCMDLISRVLLNEGDAVICEEPSFIGSLNCFRSYNAKLAGVPLEEDGMDIAALETALQTHKNARFIYVIPNFQNPTGLTTSLEKRGAILALAKKYAVPVLEDNPYGDLRFRGEALPTIKSMDTDGLVFYAGSFSKILSTGIRVGYLIAPKAVFSPLVVAKQCADVHTGMLQQLLCQRFLEQCDLDAHIAASAKIYEHKCMLMLKYMDELFPKSVRYTRPDGGLFIWAALPEGFDGGEFSLRLVKEHKVCVVPGSAFGMDDAKPANTFRLNFSMPDDDKIKAGITACANLLKEMGIN
jgi:2-aminoadipate transaminase